MHKDLRRESAAELVALDFPGYAIGGLAVGEPHEISCEIAGETAACLPPEKPRYVMGVGKPEQLVDYVRCGVDMMDCVLPTRNARNGYLYTSEGPCISRMPNSWPIRAQSMKAAPAWFAAAIRARTFAIYSGQMKFWPPS